MITYRASLDVDRDTVVFLARLLAAHRRTVGTRRRRRALTPFAQAVLVLRWFRQGTRVADLARDARVAVATAYRYRDEGIAVLAARAPDLHTELEAARDRGEDTVLLDGTLMETDRVNDRARAPVDQPGDQPGDQRRRRFDRWYSGKHHRHGGNIQVVADTAGRPLWTSPVEPGSTHDLAAARAHALPALYQAWRTNRIATLADKAYLYTGTGIRTPTLRPRGRQVPDAATAAWNAYVNSVRAAVERSIAALKTRWSTLKRVTSCPTKIGDITAAALVLHRHEQNY